MVLLAGGGTTDGSGRLKVAHIAKVESVLYGDDKRSMTEEMLIKECKATGRPARASAARIALSPDSNMTLFFDKDGEAQAFQILHQAEYANFPMERRIVPLGRLAVDDLFLDLRPGIIKEGALSSRTSSAIEVALDRRNICLAFGGVQRPSSAATSQ